MSKKVLMKKAGFYSAILALVFLMVFSISFQNCKKSENPIKFPKGIFPDTVINITDLNSSYDDYNSTLYQIVDNAPIIFSSNRKSTGGQFDLEQGMILFQFDQTSGKFTFSSKITSDPFYDKLINKAKTPGNDFGPYSFFSSDDGFEYLVLSSVNAGNLDFYYLKNQPASATVVPEIEGPFPVKLLNTAFDDAYFTFNSKQDTAFFSSLKDGNFDIFLINKPAGKNPSAWFDQIYALPVKADVLNSDGNDKCPFILKNIMVFASDRPGGSGGFDLYYSLYSNGKWGAPVNMGPSVNTSSNEYRPIIGLSTDFTNNFIIFSSDRGGGKGGYDLYFTGFEFPK
jgi:hypothetical protein